MEQLGLDVKLFIAQIINFGLFFYLYKKFIAQPLLQFIKKEKQEEKEKLEFLESIKKKEEKLTKTQLEFEQKMKNKTAEIVEIARQDGKKIRDEIINEAKKEAEEIKIRGRKLIEEERESMHSELKHRLIKLSISIINEGLKGYLSEKTKKEITQYILKNTPHVKVNVNNEN